MRLTEKQKLVILDYVRCLDPKGILENDHDEFADCDYDEAWDAIYDYLQDLSETLI